MAAQSKSETREIIVEPVAPMGFIDMRELAHYRDLIYFMILRSVKVAYAQSIGGLAWAVIQPAVQILIFSILFGTMLDVDTGGIPYPLFSTVAVIPWSYMSTAMGGASGSLVANAGMLAKIYFPRIIYLITPVVSSLVSFGVSLVLMVFVLLYYQVEMTSNIVYLPFFMILMMLTPLSLGLWLSSLAIRFRDVKILMGYFTRLMIYFVPVMYPSSSVPEELRFWYILNPFVGVLEGFRACLLGGPIAIDSMVSSTVITLVLLISGGVYFRRMERVIVDVI